jgi:hypothetical protein
VAASVLYMSMSLDGYIAGPGDEPGHPGGDAGVELQPLSMYDPGTPRRAGIVPGYGAIPTERIEEGLTVLRRCFGP